jgi:death-on-curing protein
MLEPDVPKAIEIHEKVIGENKLRGKEGLRLLESAIYVPFQTIRGSECFPDPIDKGARLLVGIIKNHPFVDGNKRTAFVLSKELLKEHGYTITGYKAMEMVDFLEKIAASQQDMENLIGKIKNFLKNWLVKQM